MRIAADASMAPGPPPRGKPPGEPSRVEPAGEQGRTGDTVELSPEAQREVARLAAEDQRVRAHEAAHMAAGGTLVRGAASYSYRVGPDGRRYAVGGEVSLDAGAVPGDPKATLAKAQRLRAAALAPPDPSGQDRAVASRAGAMAAQAASELARLKPQEGARTPSPGFDIAG